MIGKNMKKQMGLEKKTLILIAAFMSLHAVLYYGVVRMVIISRFHTLESRYAHAELERFTRSVELEMQVLADSALRWADHCRLEKRLTENRGNETDLFSQGNFKCLEANLIVLADKDQKIIAGYTLHPGGPPTRLAAAQLGDMAKTLQEIGNKHSLHGWLGPPHIATWVCIHRIGRRSARPSGYLMVGRQVSQSNFQHIENQSRCRVELFRLTPKGGFDPLPESLKGVLETVTHEKHPLLDRDDRTVMIYTLLKDLRSRPFLLAKIATPRDFTSSALQAILDVLAWSLLVGLLLTLGVLILFHRNIIRPLSALTQVVNNIHTTGDFGKKAEIPGASGEVAQLMGAFNALGKRIGKESHRREELEKQLHQSQKLESIGTLAGGIAHEFNNLLVGILGYANLLLSDLKPGQNGYEELQFIEKSSQQAADLTQQLLTFSRRTTTQAHPIDLNTALKDIAKLMKSTLPRGIEIRLHLAAELSSVIGDGGQMQQVLINLCVNARDAMPDGGCLTLASQNVLLTSDRPADVPADLPPGSYIRVSIIDTGFGMDEQVSGRAFEPFFTTKQAGQGTGLGLSIVYGIVRAVGGVIQCHSRKGEGTRFDLYFPAIDSKPTDGVRVPEAPPRGSETILVVDDEEIVRKFQKDVLDRLGYSVLTASSGEDALKRFRENTDRIELCMLDLSMPKMNGEELFDRLRALRPGVRCLIATGYFPREHEHLLEKGIRGFVQKPFQAQALARAVREALDMDKQSSKNR